MRDHCLSALLVAALTALAALIHETFTSFLQSSQYAQYERIYCA